MPDFSMIGEGESRGVPDIQYSVKYGGFSPLTYDIMPQARKNVVQKSMHTTCHTTVDHLPDFTLKGAKYEFY